MNTPSASISQDRSVAKSETENNCRCVLPTIGVPCLRSALSRKYPIAIRRSGISTPGRGPSAPAGGRIDNRSMSVAIGSAPSSRRRRVAHRSSERPARRQQLHGCVQHAGRPRKPRPSPSPIPEAAAVGLAFCQICITYACNHTLQPRLADQDGFAVGVLPGDTKRDRGLAESDQVYADLSNVD